MLSPPLRFTIVTICLVFGVWSLTKGRRAGFIPILGALVLMWVHFRCGTVWLAFGALQKGDDARAQELIAKIQSPESLSEHHRAYYSWIKGVLAGKEKNFVAARKFLTAALDGDLRTANDRCIVACLLAEIDVQMGEPAEARAHLDLLKSQPHNPQVDAMAEAVEAMMRDQGEGE